MKVILRDNLESLGQAGDIVTVKDGYARNYLIPRSLAYPATRGYLRAWEDEKRRLTVRITKETNEAERIKAQLEQLSLLIPMQVGEEGRLFGSVTNRVVAGYLKEKGYEIDHRHIVIDEAIRAAGDFEIAVRLVHGVVATIKVTVVPEAPQAVPDSAASDAGASAVEEASGAPQTTQDAAPQA